MEELHTPFLHCVWLSLCPQICGSAFIQGKVSPVTSFPAHFLFLTNIPSSFLYPMVLEVKTSSGSFVHEWLTINLITFMTDVFLFSCAVHWWEHTHWLTTLIELKFILDITDIAFVAPAEMPFISSIKAIIFLLQTQQSLNFHAQGFTLRSVN